MRVKKAAADSTRKSKRKEKRGRQNRADITNQYEYHVSGIPAAASVFDSDNEEEVYLVEKLLDFRQNRNGGREFKVKWMGYPEWDTTWEPEESLSKKVVRKFEKIIVSKKATKQKYRRKRKGNTKKTSRCKKQLTAPNKSATLSKNNNGGFAENECSDKINESPSVSQSPPEVEAAEPKFKFLMMFRENWIPEEIVGFRKDERGQKLFLVAFEGRDELRWVKWGYAKKKMPSLMISFLQPCLTWNV